MQASVIIPTYNEAENLPQLLAHIDQIQDQKLLEILLIDGGSTDQTLALAQGYSLVKTYSCPQKGRAIQMNLGAHLARGDLLYFVHADTLPPLSFLEDIAQALQEGFPMGCYRFQFNSSRKILRINAYFTRFDRLMCRGGDQSLFITAQLFRELGGFKSEYVIMEEYDLLQRARRRAPFKIMPKNILVSARKYEHNSYLKVNLANLLVFMMYFLGFSPGTLQKIYRRLLFSNS